MSYLPKITSILLAMAVSMNISAAVWKHNKQWNSEWENKYQSWVVTNKVHAEMFTSKSSPYYGISADCADAAYAIRAIFSYENKLPFAVVNPSGSRGKFKTLDNTVRKFNRAGKENKRLVAMINYIADIVGSEQLAKNDTYPVKIASVSPGSIFTYKIKARFGKYIRHVYTIKDITAAGNFDLIYSTQAIRKKKLPMNYRKQKPLVNKPWAGIWGFKKFKWPRHLELDGSQLPLEMNFSNEQYELASTMEASDFFKHVKKTLKTINETPENVVSRNLKNICTEAKARIKYVNQGVEHHNSTNGRCMNYRDYDAYSTPARDKALKNTYLTLLSDLEDINLNDVSPTLADYVETILHYEQAGLEMKAALAQYCSINYRSNVSIDLGVLWNRISSGKLSSHPNDSIEARWGETINSRTACLAHY